MELNVNLEVSNRHVHLREETYNKLFDHEITKRNDLSIPGGFAANEVVTLRVGDRVLENVRILGPFRKYDQVEISGTEARKLKVEPPVRRSGDVEGATKVTIEGEKGSVEVDAMILAKRHLHLSEEDASKYNLKDNDIVKLMIDGVRSGEMDIEIIITKGVDKVLHVDTDEGNAFLIKNGDIGKIIL